MHITKHRTGTEIEISQQEAQLQAKGYRQSNNTNEKDLSPFEYIKTSYSGSVDSFEGTTKYQLTWLE